MRSASISGRTDDLGGSVSVDGRRPAAGPELALADAYAGYEPEIRAYVASRFGGHVAAEDIVQEAFARLVREAEAGRMPRRVRPWLYRVAHNLAVSELRRPACRSVDVEEPRRPEPSVESAEVEYASWALGSELSEALGSLPQSARLSLLMAADGYSGREIATTVGRSELAVRAMLCRTRRTLRRLLDVTPAGQPGTPGLAG